MPFYCERLSSSLFAEPLNLFSNIFFLIVVVYLWRKQKPQRFFFKVFLSLIFTIGIGSTLWHSLRTSWAHKLDAYPIYLVILMTTWFLIKNLMLKTISSIAIFFGVIATLLGTLLLFPKEFLQGSMVYYVALIIVGVLVFLVEEKKEIRFDSLRTALIIFFVGVSVRSLDMPFCDINSFGTHFLWHGLSALALSYTYRGLRNI